MKKVSTGFAIRWALISLATIFVAGAFYKAGFVKTAWVTYTNLDAYKNPNANANIKVYDKDLVQAAGEKPNFDFIKKRIEIDKADINARDKYGQTALQFASSYGHKEIVEYLIAHGANLKQSDNMNRLPLHWAKNAEIADIFIKRGVPVDARDKENNTPLWAARRGKHGLVKYLLNNGADINAVDNNGQSAIMWATYNFTGFPDVVRLLIERGADLDVTNNEGMHLLDFADTLGRKEIKEMLLKRNREAELGESLLCKTNDKETVLYLISRGLSVTSCDVVARFAGKDNEFAKELVSFGAAPTLINIDDIETAEFMYEHGANITDKIIEYAIANNNINMLKFFVKKNEKIVEEVLKSTLLSNQGHFLSFQPIFEEVLSKTDDEELKDLLIENINILQQLAKNKELCDAVEAQDLGKVKSILENGQNPNIGCKPQQRMECLISFDDDCYNTTPFEIALKQEDMDIMSLLLKHGAQPFNIAYNNWGEYYSFPVLDNINSNNKKLVDLLIDNNALPFVNKYGDSSEQGKEFLKHLLERGVSVEGIVWQEFMNDKPFVEYLVTQGAKNTLCYIDNKEDFIFMLNLTKDIDWKHYFCFWGSTYNFQENRVIGLSTGILRHYYKDNKNKDILKIIAENGGDEILLTAIDHHDNDIVRFLLSARKYDLNVFLPNGDTFLTTPNVLGDIELTKILIENGADVNLLSRDGFSPLQIASRYYGYDTYKEVQKLLIDNGAK